METFKSKHGIVSKAPYMLYMAFVDLNNFKKFVPKDHQDDITADYDHLHAKVQGFDIGVCMKERTPYSRLVLEDDGAPFKFTVSLFFDSHNGNPDKTDFHVEISAELNFMMKMMLGGKIREALDKIVDGLVDVSEGRMPAGFDPSAFDAAYKDAGNTPS